MPPELLPPEGFTLENASGALSGVLAVRVGPPRSREYSYYDTFDGRLCRSGVSLVHERGSLALVERASGAVHARQATRRPARPFFPAELPTGPLRDALASLTGLRALIPVARLHARERALDVLDDEHKTVVRMTLRAPALMNADHSAAVLRLRVQALAVRGYDDELERARATLVDELGFALAEAPLVDEAVLAAGGSPRGVSGKIGVELRRGERASLSVATVLRSLRGVIEANLEGTLADIDTEFLHDLRVAVRRTRAVQRELRSVFPEAELEHFRVEFRWIQEVTGPARDLDVHLLEWDEYRAMVSPELAPGLQAVADVLAARRRRAFLAMRRALTSERARRVLVEWDEFLDGLARGSLGGPSAEAPVEQPAGERIGRLYRRMVKRGRAIGPASPPEALHELRKQGKELRYMLELFGGQLFDPGVVSPLVASLRSLQDVLGRHQDRAVQVQMLRSLQADVARTPGGADALVAMGALMQRLLEDELAARAEFARHFKDFAAKPRRRAVAQALR